MATAMALVVVVTMLMLMAMMLMLMVVASFAWEFVHMWNLYNMGRWDTFRLGICALAKRRKRRSEFCVRNKTCRGNRKRVTVRIP